MAVVDSYALYHISAGHSPMAARIRELALSGALRIVTPAAVFAVSSAMRTCWDEECKRAHDMDPGTALRDFHDRTGVEMIHPTPAFTLSAGQLYMQCGDERVVGPEVLAACHSVLLAEEYSAPLFSAFRALYCYLPLSHHEAVRRLYFIPTAEIEEIRSV